MIDTTKTFKESMEALGIAGSYVWKPNRFYAKTGSEYAQVDVVSDGSASEVEEAAGEVRDASLQDINVRKAEKLALLHQNEREYLNLLSNVQSKYQALYVYFNRIKIPPLMTVMTTGIVNLNNL